MVSVFWKTCIWPLFCPAGVCADVDGNFLVIDSNDDTVHLLNPKGEFLRIIMSTDDGLRDTTCIAIDTFGWLWIGCKYGKVHFANYQYFKSTTRQDRYLEGLKNKESAWSNTLTKPLPQILCFLYMCLRFECFCDMGH